MNQTKLEEIEKFARWLSEEFKLDNLSLEGRWTQVDFRPYVIKYMNKTNEFDKEGMEKISIPDHSDPNLMSFDNSTGLPINEYKLRVEYWRKHCKGNNCGHFKLKEIIHEL